ncbi:sensor histidine kinase [Gorillibacterium sp. sgz5001074]|uniref:sensor histidine kinase n=1 Tax=Gorillibacterium sp. sgz5001074 TaxID=3446695 RepID=UPI003F671129
MSKLRQKAKAVLGVTAVISYMSLAWVVAYYATIAIARFLGWELPALVSHLLTGASGFVIWGVTIAAIGRFLQPRRSEFVHRLLDAIRRIAKGDFNVTIEGHRSLGMFNSLVDSINHMAGELGQMEKLRQEFISNVSHEIQSPLASIGGFARALQQEDLEPDERRRYLGIIETECRRLSRLSDNLMKLTSLESEHHPFDRKPYRLDKQLSRLILVMEPQWSAKNIEMEAELEETTVTADEELMGQVWMNLIHNSLKFTPDNGTVRIRVSPAEHGGATVVVADTGIGISPEDQACMFDRFYKADKSRNRNLGGSGLGLAIVRKIVEMHGGSIQVASEPGQGTAITVRLIGSG